MRVMAPIRLFLFSLHLSLFCFSSGWFESHLLMKDPSSGAFQKVPIWARKPSSLGLAFVVMIPTGALETIQKALHDKRKFNVDESATKVKYCFSLGDKFPELESNLSMIAANLGPFPEFTEQIDVGL